jgi:hypothetical protein
MVVGWIFGIASIFWAGGPAKIAEAIATSNFVKPGGAATPVSLAGYTAPISPAFPGYDWIGVTASLFMFPLHGNGLSPTTLSGSWASEKTTKREYTLLIVIVALNCVTPLMVGAMGFAARAVWGSDLMTLAPVYGDAAATLVSMALGGPVGGAVFSMAVFAAAVSTLAGMVMIMATNVTRDLIYNLVPKASPRALLLTSRLLIIPFLAIPLWWTYTSPPPILSEFMSGSAVAQGGNILLCSGSLNVLEEGHKGGSHSHHHLRHGSCIAAPISIRQVRPAFQSLGDMGFNTHLRLRCNICGTQPSNKTCPRRSGWQNSSQNRVSRRAKKLGLLPLSSCFFFVFYFFYCFFFYHCFSLFYVLSFLLFHLGQHCFHALIAIHCHPSMNQNA